MNHVLFILVLAFVGCQTGERAITEVMIGKEFTLRVGQHVVADGGNLSITFVDVSEDSRCPDNARCVWSGNAKIHLMMSGLNFPSVPGEINTHLDPRSVSSGTYTIELVALNPYPHAGNIISPDEYVATLLVSVR